MAILISIDGTWREVTPATNNEFTVDEIQELVGGHFEELHLPDNRVLLFAEEPKLGSVVNEQATLLLIESFHAASSLAPGNSHSVDGVKLVGDVLVASYAECGAGSDEAAPVDAYELPTGEKILTVAGLEKVLRPRQPPPEWEQPPSARDVAIAIVASAYSEDVVPDEETEAQLARLISIGAVLDLFDEVVLSLGGLNDVSSVVAELRDRVRSLSKTETLVNAAEQSGVPYKVVGPAKYRERLNRLAETKAMQRAVATLKRMPRIMFEPPSEFTGWISVNVAMPLPLEPVLFAYEDSGSRLETTLGHFDVENNTWDDYESRVERKSKLVHFWQHKPEAPSLEADTPCIHDRYGWCEDCAEAYYDGCLQEDN